jgi:hypothetical protein
VSCVVATLIAWFVVIFRDKRRSAASAAALPSFPLPQHPAQSPYNNTETLSNPHSLLCFPDSGSQSSSGKDSGTGDEILELESQGICAEQGLSIYFIFSPVKTLMIYYYYYRGVNDALE